MATKSAHSHPQPRSAGHSTRSVTSRRKAGRLWTSSSPNATLRPRVSSSVLDASALLTVLLHEPGEQRTNAAIDEGAILGAVNLAEVVARMRDLGASEVA